MFLFWYCSNDFADNTTKESNPIRLQTLYYADRQKIDLHIIELLAWIHYLISSGRSRQNASRPMPARSPPKRPELQSKMRQFLILSLDRNNKPLGTQLSQEDRILLEEVIARRRSPGVSKSQELGVSKKTQTRHPLRTKSAGSSPVRESLGTTLVANRRSYNVLDIMDGLGSWILHSYTGLLLFIFSSEDYWFFTFLYAGYNSSFIFLYYLIMYISTYINWLVILYWNSWILYIVCNRFCLQVSFKL